MAHSLSQPVLTLENVCFAYSDSRVLLEDASFFLTDGQKVGLFGPNGCGKTTLFRMIVGLEQPQKGRILFRGQPVVSEKDFTSLRTRVGLVLQHAEDQLFCPTVVEDVAFGLLNLGLPPEEARERAVLTLQTLGLHGFEDRLTHRLSGGEKKLVSLATVLAMEPEVLLLDEPTNGLDAAARERIIDILNNLAAARVIISHDWSFLSRTASSFVTIQNCKLADAATVSPHMHVHAHPLTDEQHAHHRFE